MERVHDMQKFDSIDLVKFLAALCVITIHTKPFLSFTDSHYCDSIIGLLRWAVPFFFCASSYLFFKRQHSIKKYTIRLLILYLTWFVIEIPIVYRRFFCNNDTIYSNILDFTYALLFHNTFFASWYLMASLECMLLIHIFIKLKTNNNHLLIIGVLLYIPAVLSASYFGLLSNTYVKNFVTSFPFANSFTAGFLFMVIGKIIAENEFNNKYRLKWLCLFSIATFFIEVVVTEPFFRITDSYLSLPLVSFSLMLILMKTNKEIKYSMVLRKSSTLIYLLHPIIILINSTCLSMHNSFSLLVLTTLECISISFFIIQLSNKYYMFKYFY